MATFTITVPDSIGFTRQATAFAADVTKLNDTIASHLFVHGLVQKVGDSAAGTVAGEEARNAMTDTLAALTAGEWSQRGTGATVDPWVAKLRIVLRDALRLPVNKSRKEAYKKLDAENGARESYL